MRFLVVAALVAGALAVPGHGPQGRPWEQDGWKPDKDFSNAFVRTADFQLDWLECRHDSKRLQHPLYSEWCAKTRGANSANAPGQQARAGRAVSEGDQVCAPTGSLDRSTALTMAYLASAVYNTAPVTDPSWPTSYTLLATYASSGSDYGLLARHTDGHLVLAFRGTNDISDWISNVNVGSGELKEGLQKNGATIHPAVHRGFLGGFNTLRIQESCTLLFWCSQAHSPLYVALLNALAANPNTRVIITGHSRGGALASVAALHLMYDSTLNTYSAAANTALNSVRSRRAISLYTFGEPRGLKFRGEASTDTSRLDAISKYRFTYYGDPVPGTPPAGVVEPSCWLDGYCETWRHWGVAHRLWQDNPSTSEAVSWGGDQYGLTGLLENRCPNNNFPNTNADWSTQVWRHNMADSYIQTWHRLVPVTSATLPKGWSLVACMHSGMGCASANRLATTCTTLAAGATTQTAKCLLWPGTTAPTRISVKPVTGGNSSFTPTTDTACTLPINSQARSGPAFTCLGAYRVLMGGVTSDTYILHRTTYPTDPYPVAY